MALARVEETRFTKHNGNGGSLAAKTLQETVLRARETWWSKNFKWEKNLTVAGRTIEKGWVVRPQLGTALIILILTGVGTLYWTMSARIDAKDNAYQQQRDMLIEIKTELRIKKEHDIENNEKLEKRFQNVEATQIVLGRDLAKANAQR